MATTTRRTWVIKDADGNVLNEFEGIADSDWVGRELIDGTKVASVEQLTDTTREIVKSLSAEDRLLILEKQIYDLTERVEALENINVLE